MQEKLELMQNEKFLRFKCTKCGRCCSDITTFINITCFDIKRIIKHLKLNSLEILKYIGFYKFENDNDIQSLVDKLIYSPILTEKGYTFLGLLHKKNNSCIFLNDDNNNCLIYNFRPMICRAFPFTFNLNREKLNEIKVDKERIGSQFKIIYTVKGIEYCPGITKHAPIIKMNSILKILQKNLIELIKDSYFIQQWNEGVQEKRFAAKANLYINYIENLKIDSEL